MTKKELIKALDNISDDQVIVIQEIEGGWFNIENIIGHKIVIDNHYTGIFSSDKD